MAFLQENFGLQPGQQTRNLKQLMMGPISRSKGPMSVSKRESIPGQQD